MSNNPKKYRDARTGEYVTEEFALENPATTVSERIWQQGKLAGLLERLEKDGGAIVRAEDLCPDEIEEAQADGRSWGNFVFVPIEEGGSDA